MCATLTGKISLAKHWLRKAWQRVFNEYDNSQLYDYQRAMLRHLRAAVCYAMDYGHTVPVNRYRPGGPNGAQTDRDWRGDLMKVLAKILKWECLFDKDYVDEDGKVDLEGAKGDYEEMERLWDEIMDFVREDAHNLYD